MKIVWFYIIVSIKAAQPQVLIAVQFDTEKECRVHEAQRGVLKGTAAGCLPAVLP